MPLHAQGRRKGEKRSVDMGVQTPARVEPSWVRPAPDECEESSYSVPLDGADSSRDRLLVRFNRTAATDALVEFAVMQQTMHAGTWQNVASVDSCHDTDVHLHRYAKRTLERVGSPELILELSTQAEVEDGYELAYDRLASLWQENRQRWEDA